MGVPVDWTLILAITLATGRGHGCPRSGWAVALVPISRRRCAVCTQSYSAPVISPITERELRVALLRREARKRWMSTIWGAATLTFFIVVFAGFSPDRSSGRTLFYILFAVGCYSAIVRGIRLTADLFAEVHNLFELRALVRFARGRELRLTAAGGGPGTRPARPARP